MIFDSCRVFYSPWTIRVFDYGYVWRIIPVKIRNVMWIVTSAVCLPTSQRKYGGKRSKCSELSCMLSLWITGIILIPKDLNFVTMGNEREYVNKNTNDQKT